jgi:predicted permease
VNTITVVSTLLPFLLPIGIGYCLARWGNVSSATLLSLVSYVFLPAVLYNALAGRLPIDTFSYVLLSGAAVAVAGFMVAKHSHHFLKATVDPSAGFSCVACFTIPFVALCLKSQVLGTACAFFVGVALSYSLIRAKKSAPTELIKEPWIYAVIIGLFFAATKFSVPGLVTKSLAPLVNASYTIMLLYLGSIMHPFGRLNNADAWVTVVARLVSGFAIALLAIAILPISTVVAKGLMIAALAPAGAAGVSNNLHRSYTSKSAMQIGFFVSLLLMVFILFGWSPWIL